MGLDISELIQTLQAQNAIQPSGTVDSDAEKIALRVSGQFTSEDSLKGINFRFNSRFFRLSDIAKVQQGYADPQQPIFRYNGSSAIGLAVSMRKNGDVLAFGEHIKERLAKATADLTAAAGPVLAVDRRKFLELGGYDPVFFPGRIEDLDLGFRGWMAGFRGYYEPRSVAYPRGFGTFGPELGRKHCDLLAVRTSAGAEARRLRRW